MTRDVKSMGATLSTSQNGTVDNNLADTNGVTPMGASLTTTQNGTADNKAYYIRAGVQAYIHFDLSGVLVRGKFWGNSYFRNYGSAHSEIGNSSFVNLEFGQLQLRCNNSEIHISMFAHNEKPLFHDLGARRNLSVVTTAENTSDPSPRPTYCQGK